MIQSFRQSRVLQVLRIASSALRVSDWTLNNVDPDGLKYVARVWVWTHWVVSAACFIALAYRPASGLARYYVYILLFLLFVGFVGYMHYRLISNKEITWRWILGFCGMDVSVVVSAVLIGGGFSHYFLHLLFYPALAGFAVTFTSFRLNLAWVTAVSVVYLAISLTVGEGIDVLARDEKPLFIRIVVMYVITLSVNLVSRFERIRWREAVSRERAAVERERALQHERVELSRTIHDTVAQSLFLIGLGLDTAKDLAKEQNAKLVSTLEATSMLSKTSIWQLRHPIDMGHIFEGRALSDTLRSHVETFRVITSMQATVVQNGKEPLLPTETKTWLFSIVHNALTNAFRHADASEVTIELSFRRNSLQVSVSDDGIGLPDNYEERGHGFVNMHMSAERLGGHLTVESRGSFGGVSVSCVIPYREQEGKT